MTISAFPTNASAPDHDEAGRATLYWRPGRHPAAFTVPDLTACAHLVREPAHVLATPDGRLGLGVGGEVGYRPTPEGYQVVGILPPLYPEWLGDRSFCAAHGVRFPYIAGEMATGIATTTMVIEMAKAQMLGFFGAGGLSNERVEAAAVELSQKLAGLPNWGINLLHYPGDPAVEEATAAILLRHGVPCVSASAFTSITPAVVWCACHGLTQDPAGRIVRPTRVFAKLSRPELAEQFMSPPPEGMVRGLVERGLVTEQEAQLARYVPISEDITVEADSGGHTDNRPLGVLLPAILALRDRIVAQYGYSRPIRVGAAGGLGTPQGVAGAFALGAGYVLTGSINQAAVESGQSDDVKAMLAQADLADVAMAPSADMFELGVKVQVLRRGTMFAPRAAALYEAYRLHNSLDELSPQVRAKLERDVFRGPIEQVWEETAEFWRQREPGQLERAERDPKHRMALVFRWYLGSSSRWAVRGSTDRRTDYQVWCGPAMGAFNRWVAGTYLADPANRTVTQIALNLLEGAAVATRAHQMRTYGFPIPVSPFTPRPLLTSAGT